MGKYNYQLKFPSYDELKALPFRAGVADDKFRDYLEYEILLFNTPIDVYGRFTLNENGEGYIIFDVMENGCTGENRWEKSLKFNKKNYKEICEYANMVYDLFIETMLRAEYAIGPLY